MSDTCGRCGRRLKDPFFREVGYGRTCAAKLGITLPQKKEKGKRTDLHRNKGNAQQQHNDRDGKNTGEGLPDFFFEFFVIFRLFIPFLALL